jgi:glycosyltransferase involved in cell wall biosynthesis
MMTEKKQDISQQSINQGGQRTHGIKKKSLIEKPLISIITVVFNGGLTLEDTILSVLEQTYSNIEYIIIDGGSNDNTLEIIQKYDAELDFWISEGDEGIYDAMNKGIKLATGDYIGILNSDDFFSNPQVIKKIAERFLTKKIDVVFSQLDVVDNNNSLRVLRKYRVKVFSIFMLRIGVMPAHPTFYCRKSCYQKLGPTLYRTDYKIASDFELLLRLLLTQNVSWSYIAETTVIMRSGGVSSANMKSRLILNREIIQACKENGIYTNILMLLLKIPMRLLELIR